MVKIDKYMRAGIITLLIFFGGMFVIKTMDDQRVASLNKDMQQLGIELEDSRLFMTYLESISENKTLMCQALKEQIQTRVDKNQDLIYKLGSYENVNVFGEEYYGIKNNFILKNMELWLFFENFRKKCGGDDVSILYFYPDREQCNECSVQAQVLNKLRDECLNIKVFAFPVNSNIGTVNVVKNRFEINKTPSIVINSEHVFQGIATEEGIMEHITCSA